MLDDIIIETDKPGEEVGSDVEFWEDILGDDTSPPTTFLEDAEYAAIGEPIPLTLDDIRGVVT